jgi:hypothetical protein
MIRKARTQAAEAQVSEPQPIGDAVKEVLGQVETGAAEKDGRKK